MSAVLHRDKILFVLILLLSLILSSCSHPDPYQAALEQALESSGTVGAVAAVLDGDTPLWQGAAGWSDPVVKVPMSTDMLFNIGSVGKNYVATIILTLADEGKLSLDDPLSCWYPEPLKYIDPAITVRQLLNHRSGIFDFIKHPESPWQQPFADTRIWQPGEVLAELINEPYFAPGEGFHYSTTNYLLLQQIAQKAADERYSDLLERCVIEPLGLHNTLAGVPGRQILQAADSPVSWIRADGRLWNMSATGQSWETCNPHRVLCTADDLAKYMHHLFYDKDLLSEKGMEAMLDFRSPAPADFPMAGYGAGLCHFDETASKQLFGQAINMIGHFGSGIGYRAAALYLPEQEKTLIVLINEHSDEGLVAIISAMLEKIITSS